MRHVSLIVGVINCILIWSAVFKMRREVKKMEAERRK